MDSRHYPDFYHQIRAELVRQIRDAKTWSDRVDAFQALCRTMNDAAEMEKESRHLYGDGNISPLPEAPV